MKAKEMKRAHLIPRGHSESTSSKIFPTLEDINIYSNSLWQFELLEDWLLKYKVSWYNGSKELNKNMVVLLKPPNPSVYSTLLP